MGRFQHEFEPLTKAQAERIAEEIETAEHIEKLRSMRRDRNTQAGTGIAMAGTMHDPKRSNEWVNSYFLVQEFQEENGVIRLSVNTTSMANSGRWKDGISWDALQEIKNAVGYADRDAVEIYPAQKDVVNVANMRHLWLVNEPLTFAWRKD